MASFFFWLGLLKYHLPAVRFYLYVQLCSLCYRQTEPSPTPESLSCLSAVSPQPWQPSVSSVEHHPDASYRKLPFVSSCIRHNACVTQQWDSRGWQMLTAYSPKQNKTRQKTSQPWLGTFGGYCSVIIATAYSKPHKPPWQSRNSSTKGAVRLVPTSSSICWVSFSAGYHDFGAWSPFCLFMINGHLSSPFWLIMNGDILNFGSRSACLDWVCRGGTLRSYLSINTLLSNCQIVFQNDHTFCMPTHDVVVFHCQHL